MPEKAPIFFKKMNRLILFSALLLVFSCSDGPTTPPSQNTFDRSLLLSDLYNNNIIPSYENFNTNLAILETDLDNLINNPNQQNLNQAQNSMNQAYVAWQSIAMFNLRVAEEVSYASLMNSYPANTDKINQNISEGITQIGSFTGSKLGATGFPALSYLLFGMETSQVLEQINSSINYCNYMTAITNNMRINLDLIINDWSANSSEFINSSGNTQTSSLNIVINDFLQYFEKRVREAKIATPLDYRGSLQPRPEQVESYYFSSLSKDLLVEAFLSVKRFYTGDSFDGLVNGVGVEDYLLSLENTSELIDAMDNQINNIDQKISLLNDDLTIQLTEDNQKMIDVFLSMQTLVTYFKSDVYTFIGISPDYADNDGDGG